MPRKLRAASARAKSASIRIRNQNCRIRNQISPVMAVVNSALPADKRAYHLHILTGEPLSSCQKMLSGHRSENLDMLRKLMAGQDVDFAAEVLKAFVGADAPIAKAMALQQDLRRAQAMIRTLKARIAE